MPFPNPWANPDFFRNVKVGGRLVKASLVAIDGIKIEDEWNEQRSTGTSGATFVFRGTKPAGPSALTFEAVDVAEFDDLRELYEMLAPKPGGGANSKGNTQGSPGSAAYGKGYVQAKSTGATATAPSAEALLAQAQAALVAAQNGAVDPTVTATSSTPVSVLSPGPKPPTLSIENGYLNYIGITAISRKSWEGPRPTPTNSFQVTIGIVPQREPTKVSVGAASPKAKDNPGQKYMQAPHTTGPASSAKAANAAASQWAAG